MNHRLERAILAFVIRCGTAFPQDSAVRTVHVFVALADNKQSRHRSSTSEARKRYGEDAEHNLYRGSAYGLKTLFARGPDWRG